MIFQVQPHEDYILVELLVKEANLAYADTFKQEMVKLIDRESKPYIISFKNVDYVDSSFLGALVSSLKYAISKHADIAVAYLNKDILNLFSLIRMDKVFKIHQTLPPQQPA
ncbi:STAS domain-containing protein [Pedobacter sp. BS3]|uniref:STAS domain-containing protein n=1 Tax=Pedobacter sp. BS3 TaxID=2567937 RepID=UPI0011EDEB0D|nr:STAS domain-containing protein [Pedobacter sp. BS3]TZF84760.1 STAS domain-containing protein [Pedobacter sp. BS3]